MRRLYWYDAVILRLVFFLVKSLKLSKIVLVLRSASVERFDVSRMRDFYIILLFFRTSKKQQLLTIYGSKIITMIRDGLQMGGFA